jgi:hypothetical protein
LFSSFLRKSCCSENLKLRKCATNVQLQVKPTTPRQLVAAASGDSIFDCGNCCHAREEGNELTPELPDTTIQFSRRLSSVKARLHGYGIFHGMSHGTKLVPQKVRGTSRVNGGLPVVLSENHGISNSMSHDISNSVNGPLVCEGWLV